MGLLIRHAGKADLASIVAIYNASIPGHLATADTERHGRLAGGLVRGIQPGVTADLGGRHRRGQHRGMARFPFLLWPPGLSPHGRTAVFVAPAHQREGVARRLLTYALAQCPDLAIANVLAFVFAHNMPSVTLSRPMASGAGGLLPKVCEIDGKGTTS
jgi:phosphinothricin acetyltransferase